MVPEKGRPNVWCTLHLDDGLVWTNLAHLLRLFGCVHWHYHNCPGIKFAHLHRGKIPSLLFCNVRTHCCSSLPGRTRPGSLSGDHCGNVQHILQCRMYMFAEDPWDVNVTNCGIEKGSVLSTSAVYSCHKYLAHRGNLDWRIPLWLQMVCPGLVCLVIKFYPESPRW
jgi:hypothetical protein